MQQNTQKLALGLRGLAVFRGLLAHPLVAALLPVLEYDGASGAQFATCRGALAAELYKAGGNLGEALLRLVMECENPVARLSAAGKPVPPVMAGRLSEELALFTELSRFMPPPADDGLPSWANTPQDFEALYTTRLAEMHTKGYGIFAAYHMFTLGEGGRLYPVHNPDPQELAGLTGYERERGEVVLNTKALLQGLPANNILLYGDAGTGKSSTVKAVVNEFCGQGLRLVEVRKNQLYAIPELMDSLAENPLKFILFIDDLSFPADDGDFTALKAILEGNVAARPGNIVVYATSNRRHMMRQAHSARQGDEVHVADTLEEEASLSARFGLTVTFLKPDRDLYAGIVLALAGELGLLTPEADLLARAEAHAIRHGGRSPRTARQFVELTLAQERLEG